MAVLLSSIVRWYIYVDVVKLMLQNLAPLYSKWTLSIVLGLVNHPNSMKVGKLGTYLQWVWFILSWTKYAKILGPMILIVKNNSEKEFLRMVFENHSLFCKIKVYLKT